MWRCGDITHLCLWNRIESMMSFHMYSEIECNPWWNWMQSCMERESIEAQHFVCTVTLICFNNLWSAATSVSCGFISQDYVICTLDAVDRVKECFSEARILWIERKCIYNAPSAVWKRMWTHWGFIMYSKIGHFPPSYNDASSNIIEWAKRKSSKMP